MNKLTIFAAVLVLASGVTTSAAVFSAKQPTTDVAAQTAAVIAKVQSLAPPTMTMQRPI